MFCRNLRLKLSLLVVFNLMPETDFDDFPLRRAMRPTLRTWVKHSILLLLTLFTATIAGNLYPFGAIPLLPNFNPQSWIELIYALPFLSYYLIEFFFTVGYLIFTDLTLLIGGLKFSLSLLFILTCHEAGHYIACRIYGVDATLPYFIPLPLLSPAGTLGAFIKIQSPLPSRKATFDIGVAGPIAGFIAIIPIAIIAFMTMTQVSPELVLPAHQGDLYFSDSLFTKSLAYIFGFNLNYTFANSFYFACWVGLLVTSLNLIPSGQLDGGHAVYSVFGERIHQWTGRIAFGVMVMLSILGMYFYGTPSALLFTILLGVMMKIKHPEPLDNSPLDNKRKVVAFLTLVIFILCFVPFPIQIK